MSAVGRVDNWQSVLTNTEDSRRDYPADNANPHYITFQYMKLQPVTALFRTEGSLVETNYDFILSCPVSSFIVFQNIHSFLV